MDHVPEEPYVYVLWVRPFIWYVEIITKTYAVEVMSYTKGPLEGYDCDESDNAWWGMARAHSTDICLELCWIEGVENVLDSVLVG